MKLQSSQSFGKTLADKSDAEYRRLRDNYDAFIELPLHPYQFVAMDDDGNVLEEPNKQKCNNCTSQVGFDCCNDIQFNKAQSKVLFEGWDIQKVNDNDILIYREHQSIYFFDTNEVRFCQGLFVNSITTISDLIPYNLTLTANAKQIIGV